MRFSRLRNLLLIPIPGKGVKVRGEAEAGGRQVFLDTFFAYDKISYKIFKIPYMGL